MIAPVVDVRNVSVAYRLSRGGAGSLKEAAVRMLKGQVRHESLWAVVDVSFTVAHGEILGVIGANGAGKTTLLKLLARVLPPTRGRVIVRGSVAPLIALGAGFNPELTGFENILLYGTILGNDPLRMRRRAAAIAEWADLTDFLDVPLRSYSSGMLARLGFAIATDAAPHVLLVDEVLAVGDEVFRQRSTERISRLITAGTAVVLVTHDLDAVTRLAGNALWLAGGRTVLDGAAADVVDAYRSHASTEAAERELAGV